MKHPLSFTDLQVGDRFVTHARTITEADVVNFACFSGDYDPLHTDHEFAKTSPFGRPIAHGLLGLSWVAGLSIQNPWVRTVAFVSIEQWKFLKPLYIGDTVHVVTEVAQMQQRGRKRGQVTWKRQLINQRGEVTQEGELVTLVELHPQRRETESG
ncbi:MAG: MaoC/PaaZ C-terminal domain-containing protein [Pirellulaceae bacterium]